MTDPVISALSSRVEQIDHEIRDLREFRNVVKGNWGSPGVFDRLKGLEDRQQETRTILDAVKTQQKLNDQAIKTKDEQRDKDQQKRDKRIQQYLGGLIALVTTILGGLVINFLSSGVIG